jgi:hypothetical protein
VTARAGAEAPLFILGAPRSGTTLLYKSLCLHPDAAWISNYLHRFPTIPSVSLLNRAARVIPAVQRDVWFGKDSNAYVYGRNRSLRERLVPMPVEGEPLFERCGLPQDPSTVSLPAPERNRRVRAAFQGLTRYGGGSTVVSKRIGHNRRVPLLHGAFPEARFVHLVRDGRAVACSLADVDWWGELVIWWYGGTPRDWSAAGKDPWELCARHWVEELRCVEEGIAHVPDEQRLRLHYEDLVRDPLQALEQVAKFSGLAPDQRWISSLRELQFPNQNERWPGLLDDAAKHVIEEVQQPLLKEYGYLA